MKVWFNDRIVVIEAIEHNKEPEDSYVTEAHFEDDGAELNEEELIELTEEQGDLIYEDWYEYRAEAAEWLAEGYKDGSY